MSRSKEFIAIKIEESIEFYIKIGKYLDQKYYEIKQTDSRIGRYNALYLKVNNQEIKVEYGFYILIDLTNNDVKYVHKDIYKNDYVELKEED